VPDVAKKNMSKKYTKKEKIKNLETMMKLAEKEMHGWVKFFVECEYKLKKLR
jgi:hypothetical protein